MDHYHWPTLRKEGREESFPLSPLAASIWLKGLRAATDRNIKVKSDPTAQGQLFANKKGVRGRFFFAILSIWRFSCLSYYAFVEGRNR